jgi:hypothetical protein
MPGYALLCQRARRGTMAQVVASNDAGQVTRWDDVAKRMFGHTHSEAIRAPRHGADRSRRLGASRGSDSRHKREPPRDRLSDRDAPGLAPAHGSAVEPQRYASRHLLLLSMPVVTVAFLPTPALLGCSARVCLRRQPFAWASRTG